MSPAELNGNLINSVGRLKHLGIILNENLKYDLHFHSMNAKVSKQLYYVREINIQDCQIWPTWYYSIPIVNMYVKYGRLA